MPLDASQRDACLRAFSSSHAEIVFRIHAEFKLDEPTAYFTPAQFTGRLVINRNKGSVCHFHLYLPPLNSNVDINAFHQADMVFVLRMELIGQDETDKTALKEIKWDAAITEAEACKLLVRRFYKFSEIEWTPFEKVVEKAQTENKPIHALVLFGTLDDESC